jgi:transcriptional regulator with XRE-family HTH domain
MVFYKIMRNDVRINEKVANFIKEKRLALGMTQKEFAVHLFGHEKHQGWIAKIEGRKRGITLDTLGRIFEKLDADLSIIEY